MLADHLMRCKIAFAGPSHTGNDAGCSREYLIGPAPEPLRLRVLARLTSQFPSVPGLPGCKLLPSAVPPARIRTGAILTTDQQLLLTCLHTVPLLMRMGHSARLLTLLVPSLRRPS
ncbi:hypothetical protein PAPYR_12443 [Paratrimastix pyriformis]|uniref:Uncharacterized protein n=1 Tax=Paratrimastix pyriformis TaxID=342808 RepID=A0ABQ8U3I1_9EUKA|nr:hypothetical protein PAPYR_12443 [Paratrimastix pyriformis]